MKAKNSLILLFALAISLISAQLEPNTAASAPSDSLFADSLKIDIDGKSRLDSLFYEADSIRAYYAEEQIYLYGNTSINYGQSNIQADSLFIDLKKEQANTWGPTLLQDGDQLLIGSDVRYDVRSQTGILAQGQSFIENGYYDGHEIRKISSNVYDIDGGSFTTCDLEEPSYWFWAKAMRIYQRDKVVGKHVLAYVNHLPIFYFPFVTMSIKRGRQPGFLIPEPGYNNIDGKYIKDLAYYYPYKDFADLILGLDLKEKTGWKTNFRSEYIRRYYYSGSLKASYQKNINSAGTTFDWSLRGNHHHDLPEKSSLDVSLDFVSNKRIFESSDLVDESLAQWLTSSISYRKPIGNTYFNAGAVYNQDLINDTANLNLPTMSWSLPSRPFYELFKGKSDAWYSNLSFYYNTRLDHTGNIRKSDPAFSDYIWENTIDPADSTRYVVEHHAGLKQMLGITNNYNYRGWLNLRQSMDYSEAWYDRDKKDHKWVRGNDYSASLNGSFNLYGIRNFETGPISAIRHTLSPSIGLTYLPDFSDNQVYYSFGGISLKQGDKQANLNLGIDQKWQLKLGRDRDVRKLNELFTWSSRISANLFKDDKRFGNFSHSLAFRPGTFDIGKIQNNGFKLDALKLGYAAQLNLSQDTYRMQFDDLAIQQQYFTHSISLSGTTPYNDYFVAPQNRTFQVFGQQQSQDDTQTSQVNNNWSLSIVHDLYAPKTLLNPDSQNLRLNALLNLTKNYSLSYNNYYNLKTNQLISQGLSISRDLHCWKLDITFTKRNEYWDYRIIFFNKQFPEALRFQTRDSKRY
ncbi:MAG: putative LPS assembly protein LptD [Candidatus Cloacimonetes bacterium]|nr:putative LPS assembly protein LptD [Candidatus Cloacimonadota bacterium]